MEPENHLFEKEHHLPSTFIFGGSKCWFWRDSYNYFHLYCGKWSKLTHVFQVGWHHQVAVLQFITDCQAGSALHSSFIRGRRVVTEGLPMNCDLQRLRQARETGNEKGNLRMPHPPQCHPPPKKKNHSRPKKRGTLRFPWFHVNLRATRCITIWIIHTCLFSVCAPNYTCFFNHFIGDHRSCKVQKKHLFHQENRFSMPCPAFNTAINCRKNCFGSCFLICLLPKVRFFTQPLNGWCFSDHILQQHVGLPTMWNSNMVDKHNKVYYHIILYIYMFRLVCDYTTGLLHTHAYLFIIWACMYTLDMYVYVLHTYFINMETHTDTFFWIHILHV